MTDYNFSEAVFYAVFPDGNAEEMHIRGIFEAVETLFEKEQIALKYRLGDKMTYKKIGQQLGLSEQQARTIVKRALRKLRHPSRCRRMRVPDIENGYLAKLKAKNKILTELIHGLDEVVCRAEQQILK